MCICINYVKHTIVNISRIIQVVECNFNAVVINKIYSKNNVFLCKESKNKFTFSHLNIRHISI